MTSRVPVTQTKAQDEAVQDQYTDPETGIEFETWSTIPDTEGRGAFTFGMALPSNATSNDATEYIGFLVRKPPYPHQSSQNHSLIVYIKKKRCQSYTPERKGWCGLSHAGPMLNTLLLIAYPYETKVHTSFRLATDYFMPDPYPSPTAKLTQIRSLVNESTFEVVYRCEGCFAWDAPTGPAGVHTSKAEEIMLGHAAALDTPENPSCPSTLTFGFHNNGFGMLFGKVSSLAKENYEDWIPLANQTVEEDCDV